MPKRRLGVVLLVPAPFDREVDGLRRATGDGNLHAVPPHLTLVPPVNVRDDRLDEALALVRRAAAATRPLRLVLGPPATFLPVNPVLYLSVGGDLDGVLELRDRVFAGPLERPLSWSFVPHVTLVEDLDADRMASALVALASYEAEVTVERVHVLEEQPGRTWMPIADYPFAPAAIVGRGGLPLELTTSQIPERSAHSELTVTARRDGSIVGSVTVRLGSREAVVTALEVSEDQRREGIGSHLLAAACSEAAARGALEITAPLLERFLVDHGWTVDPDARTARRTL